MYYICSIEFIGAHLLCLNKYLDFFFKVKANQGGPIALAKLAHYHLNGDGVKLDVKKSVMVKFFCNHSKPN